MGTTVDDLPLFAMGAAAYVPHAAMPEKHRHILRAITSAGQDGASLAEIHDYLRRRGFESADVARDLSDMRRRFGLPRDAVICNYERRTANGAVINRWTWNKEKYHASLP